MSSLLSLAFDSGWLPTGPHESFSILIAHRGSHRQSVLIRGDAARSYSESFRGQLGFNLEDLFSSCGPSSGPLGAPGPVGGGEAIEIHREPSGSNRQPKEVRRRRAVGGEKPQESVGSPRNPNGLRKKCGAQWGEEKPSEAVGIHRKSIGLQVTTKKVRRATIGIHREP